MHRGHPTPRPSPLPWSCPVFGVGGRRGFGRPRPGPESRWGYRPVSGTGATVVDPPVPCAPSPRQRTTASTTGPGRTRPRWTGTRAWGSGTDSWRNYTGDLVVAYPVPVCPLMEQDGRGGGQVGVPRVSVRSLYGVTLTAVVLGVKSTLYRGDLCWSRGHIGPQVSGIGHGRR